MSALPSITDIDLGAIPRSGVAFMSTRARTCGEQNCKTLENGKPSSCKIKSLGAVGHKRTSRHV